jgi:hypothetical protein
MELVVAVLIPCFNEARSIGEVVRTWRSALPAARIYVFDNNSADETRQLAADAGAIVRSETRQGKGNVVRRMFADVDADIYILVDGDGTYDAAAAPGLISVLLAGSYDMVVGTRRAVDRASFRPGHLLGNRILSGVVGTVFGKRISDLLSGYRVLSHRFVKSFPALSTGFEVETELSVHALELGIPFCEVDTRYFARPGGSSSKLDTFRDGWRIVRTIANLVRRERPLALSTCVAAGLAAPALVIGFDLWIDFMETGLVPRFPSAILATGLMLTAFLSLACGLILDAVTHGRREIKRLAYLRLQSIGKQEHAAPMCRHGIHRAAAQQRS